MNRFSRQIKLPQVGEEGQRRIGLSHLQLCADLDAATSDMARLYARAVGLLPETGEVPLAKSPLPSALVEAFDHPASRATGLGAALALSSTLRALESATAKEPIAPSTPLGKQGS